MSEAGCRMPDAGYSILYSMHKYVCIVSYFEPFPHMMTYKARNAMCEVQYSDFGLRTSDVEPRTSIRGWSKCGSRIYDCWMLLMLRMDEG